MMHFGLAAVIWLCRPGMANNPCAAPFAVSTIVAGKVKRVRTTPPAAASKFDCFYVYPTVSLESSANADVRVQRSERGIAVAQGSPFSSACNVWAPMYRQITLRALFDGRVSEPRYKDVAYSSLVRAWREYLARDNRGRPIIFIGHSQGAIMLTRLLREEIDPNPALRKRFVLAILLGGNVVAPDTPHSQGSFAHIPACTAYAETGCVIAYSTFAQQPPANARYGIPGQGASLPWQTARTGVHVLCTNPGSLSGGGASLTAYFTTVPGPEWAPTHVAPPGVFTPWVAYPNLFNARCERHGNASWLNVARNGSSGDWPHLTPGAPSWGLHVDDMSIGLGALIDDVIAAEAAYTGSVRTNHWRRHKVA